MGLVPDPPDAPELIPHFDKVIHFAAYGVWGVLLFINRRLPAWCLIFACLLAFIQEATQLTLEERSFEWWDWGADSTGILCGWGAVQIIWKYGKWKEIIV